MKTCHLTLFIFLISFYRLWGQGEAENRMLDIIPPSPMAHEITRFEAQQPDLYTGAMRLNIPLYTIDFDGWNLPLTLNYFGSGIQTNQEATEAGLGWGLNATGVITRQIKKINDLYEGNTSGYKGYIYAEDLTEKIANYSNLEFNERTVVRENLKYGRYDTEPDLFNYNFFGFSGSFTLSKIESEKTQVLKQNADGVKISFDLENKNFQIITPNGYIGLFSIKERTTNLAMRVEEGGSLSFQQLGYDYLSIQNRGGYRAITSWYLEKITSPYGREIYFDYDLINGESPYATVTSPAIGEENLPGHQILFNNGAGAFYIEEPFKWYISQQVHENVYQKGIRIPNGLHISFNMEDRSDIQNASANIFSPFGSKSGTAKRYSSILVKESEESQNVILEVTLNNSYFNEDVTEFDSQYSGIEDFQYLRSRLDAISINEKTYTFKYEEDKGLPDKSTLAVDHFGFYNGNLEIDALYPPRHGYSFEKVANVESFNGLPAIVNGSVLEEPYGYSIETITDAPEEDATAIGNIIERSIFESLPNLSYYVQREERKPSLEYAKQGILREVIYPTEGSSIYEYELNEYFGKGISELSVLVPEAINSEGEAGNIKGGGLRIKSIESKDYSGTLISKKEFSYEMDDDITSSGVLMTPFVYLNFEEGKNANFYSQYCNVSENVVLNHNVFHRKISIPGNNTASGKRIGYSRVVEQTTDFDSNNKIGLEFNYVNIPTLHHVENSLLKNNDRKNGLLTKKVYKDGYEFEVKQKEFLYKHRKIGAVKSLHYEVFFYDFFRNSSYYNYVTPFHGACGVNNFYYIPLISYEYPIEIVEQIETKETTSFSSGNKISIQKTQENQFYTDLFANLLKKETLLTSKNQNQITKFLYPQDIIDSGNDKDGMMAKLKELHRIGKPIEVSTYLADTDGNEKKLSTEKTVYKEENNLVLPSIVQTAKATNDLEDRYVYNRYDNYGNLLEYHMAGENTPHTVLLWGYGGTSQIAKIENATYSEVQTALGFNEDQEVNETHLTSINTLRGSKTDWMITTYRHKPLVGVTQITQPNGVITKYEYDDFNRLKSIKDGNDNIVKSYYINYINQYDSLQEPTNGENTNTDNENETRSFELASEVYAISSEFQNIGIQIFNNGNSPLSITKVNSDDDCLNITSNLNNFTVLPNSSNTIYIQLQCRLNTEDNWDGEGNIHIWTDANTTVSFRTVKILREYLEIK